MPTSTHPSSARAAGFKQSSTVGQSAPFALGASQAAAGYTPFTDLGGASPLEAEILAFGLCNARLGNAADQVSRIQALHKNQQLWSMLVRDLSSEGNALPDELKQQLIALGFWAMQYGTLAINNGLPLQPLIGVNRNILEGLRGQAQLGSSSVPPKTHTDNACSNEAGSFIASA